MKTLGLIGGSSYVSTIDYYRVINQQVNEQLGGLYSAKMLLYSLNFADLAPLANPIQIEKMEQLLIPIAQNLEKAGADGIVLCANTPHLVADSIQKVINIPLINIAEATANEIAEKQLKKVALLGTKITMEEAFFKDKLLQKGIETLIPDANDRQFIHDAVFNEFGKGIFLPETKSKFIGIAKSLIADGAEGIILGCTEFPHVIKPEDSSVPLFDTTIIHATAAVK